jgi:hypothetical protein
MIAVIASLAVVILSGLILGIGAFAGRRHEEWVLPMGDVGHPLDGPDVIVTWNVDFHAAGHVT